MAMNYSTALKNKKMELDDANIKRETAMTRGGFIREIGTDFVVKFN